MKTRRALAAHGRRRLLALDTLIAGTYPNAEAALANKIDPLDEAVYIILSFQTDIERLPLGVGTDAKCVPAMERCRSRAHQIARARSRTRRST